MRTWGSEFIQAAAIISALTTGTDFAAAQQHDYRLFLEAGTTIAGQEIDPADPVMYGIPGAKVPGVFNYRTENDAVGATLTVDLAVSWEGNDVNWATIGTAGEGVVQHSFPFEDLILPSAAGTHYIVLGALPEPSGGYVASMTHSTCSNPVWNDGNDLTIQNETTLAGALTSGWAMLPLWTSGAFPQCDHFEDVSTAATYVKVIIPALTTGACCIDHGVFIECRVTTPEQCALEGGVYHGDDVPCDPWPCPPSPTIPITWGGIRATYR